MKVTGIGTAFVDYFLEGDLKLLKKYGVKPEDDFLFEDINLNPKFIFSRFKLLGKSPGGNAPNTLAVLSKLGIDSHYFGIIGKDENGKYWEKNIEKVNLESIIRKGKNSYTTALLTNGGKERTFLSELNKFDNDFFEEINSRKIEEPIFLGPLFLNPEKNIIKISEYILETRPIFFSPGIFYIKLGLKKLKPILKKTEIIFLNQDELLRFLNNNLKKGSKELLKYGPKVIVCTMGEKGALITTEKEQFFSPGIKTKKVVDTTGAGDAFAAGFLFGVLNNKSLSWSANFGNKMGAKSVTDYGLNWLSKI